MPLTALIAAALVFSSLAAQAEDLAGTRLHLADGRTLEGRYDDITGKMRLSGPGEALIDVAKADIVSSEDIVLAPTPVNVDDAATRKLKGERSSLIVVLRKLDAALGPHPEAELESWGARLSELPALVAAGRARIEKLGDTRDDYRRQIALKETTTATAATNDSTTLAHARERVVVVGEQGLETTYRVAVDTIERRSEVAAAVEQVTLEAARDELTRLDASIEDLRHAVTQMRGYADQLAARVAATKADVALRDRHRKRLIELEAMLSPATSPAPEVATPALR